MTRKKKTKAHLAQIKRDQESQRHEMALNKARDKREVNSAWIKKLAANPRRADTLKKDMIKDLIRVFNTRHKVFGNTAGRDRYRQLGNYSEVLVRLVFGTHAKFKECAELADTPTMRKGASRAAKLLEAQKVAAYAKKHLTPFASNHAFRGARGSDGHVHVLVSSDHHSSKMNPFAMRVLRDVTEWIQPDYSILNGDVLEFSAFSTHRHLPGHFDMNAYQEVEFAKEHIIRPLKEAAPNARHIFGIGNHEYRMVNYLADRGSALACFPDISFVKLLGLDEMEIDLMCRSNFLAPTSKMRKQDIAENWMTIEERLLVTHGLFTGPNACNAHFKKFHMTGISGHEHCPHFQSFNSLATGPCSWNVSAMMAGPGVGRDYVPLHTNWQSGFSHATVCLKTGHVQVSPILIGDTATFAGRSWTITPAEKRTLAKQWEV